MITINNINPVKVFKSIIAQIHDLNYYKKYVLILDDLDRSGDLQRMQIMKETDFLLIGVDLNPELLVYQEETITSAELRLVADRMKKYTAFLQKHGILDSIKADYERIKNDDYYGYLVNISYNFKNYNKTKLVYSVIYVGSILAGIIAAAIYLATNIN